MGGKNIVLAIIVASIVVLAALLLLAQPEPVTETELVPEPEVVLTEPEPLYTQRVIGTSVQGRDIEAYQFGTGETDLLFVGGMHGGYEWNSVVLAYEFVDRFMERPELIPENITVHIIPNLNPDAVALITGKDGRFTQADILPNVDQTSARFNANGVDLNRNFDCKWQSTSSWRGKTVSAGTAAFSEPEAVALGSYVQEQQPQMVAFWHAQANNVYASECENGVLPETLEVMQTYADAAGYGAVPSFDAYPITGDAEGWLASIGIPAVTVELASHESLDLEQNIAGVDALLSKYSAPELAR
tara:strand:+ start:1481 stop:2383 length:903 start_codon:yes stop_codon:yes gene_type:complete